MKAKTNNPPRTDKLPGAELFAKCLEVEGLGVGSIGYTLDDMQVEKSW